MVFEFNNRESASMKSFAVKKRNEINVTTWYMSGKLLTFAKLKPFVSHRNKLLICVKNIQ